MKENLLVMISISSSNKDKLKDISNKISKTFVKHIILYHIRNYIQKENLQLVLMWTAMSTSLLV